MAACVCIYIYILQVYAGRYVSNYFGNVYKNSLFRNA